MKDSLTLWCVKIKIARDLETKKQLPSYLGSNLSLEPRKSFIGIEMKQIVKNHTRIVILPQKIEVNETPFYTSLIKTTS